MCHFASIIFGKKGNLYLTIAWKRKIKKIQTSFTCFLPEFCPTTSSIAGVLLTKTQLYFHYLLTYCLLVFHNILTNNAWIRFAIHDKFGNWPACLCSILALLYLNRYSLLERRFRIKQFGLSFAIRNSPLAVMIKIYIYSITKEIADTSYKSLYSN